MVMRDHGCFLLFNKQSPQGPFGYKTTRPWLIRLEYLAAGGRSVATSKGLVG